MKGKLLVLSAIISAAAATGIAIVGSRKRYANTYREAPDDNLEAEGEALPRTGEVLECDAMEYLTVELRGTDRKILLRPDGRIERYEGEKLIDSSKINEWPEGNYRIHVSTAKGYYWLLFEKCHNSFFKWSKFEPGYYAMDYCMVLNGSFEPFMLGPAVPTGKDGEKWYEMITDLGDMTTDEALTVGENVWVRVPKTAPVGDTDTRFETIAYVLPVDGNIYVCNIEKSRIYRGYARLGREFRYIGSYIAIGFDGYYGYMDLALPHIPNLYKDKFGEYSLDRFAKSLEASGGYVDMRFYESCEVSK